MVASNSKNSRSLRSALGKSGFEEMMEDSVGLQFPRRTQRLTRQMLAGAASSPLKVMGHGASLVLNEEKGGKYEGHGEEEEVEDSVDLIGSRKSKMFTRRMLAAVSRKEESETLGLHEKRQSVDEGEMEDSIDRKGPLKSRMTFLTRGSRKTHRNEEEKEERRMDDDEGKDSSSSSNLLRKKRAWSRSNHSKLSVGKSCYPPDSEVEEKGTERNLEESRTLRSDCKEGGREFPLKLLNGRKSRPAISSQEVALRLVGLTPISAATLSRADFSFNPEVESTRLLPGTPDEGITPTRSSLRGKRRSLRQEENNEADLSKKSFYRSCLAKKLVMEGGTQTTPNQPSFPKDNKLNESLKSTKTVNMSVQVTPSVANYGEKEKLPEFLAPLDLISNFSEQRSFDERVGNLSEGNSEIYNESDDSVMSGFTDKSALIVTKGVLVPLNENSVILSRKVSRVLPQSPQVSGAIIKLLNKRSTCEEGSNKSLNHKDSCRKTKSINNFSNVTSPKRCSPRGNAAKNTTFNSNDTLKRASNSLSRIKLVTATINKSSESKKISPQNEGNVLPNNLIVNEEIYSSGDKNYMGTSPNSNPLLLESNTITSPILDKDSGLYETPDKSYVTKAVNKNVSKEDTKIAPSPAGVLADKPLEYSKEKENPSLFQSPNLPNDDSPNTNNIQSYRSGDYDQNYEADDFVSSKKPQRSNHTRNFSRHPKRNNVESPIFSDSALHKIFQSSSPFKLHKSARKELTKISEEIMKEISTRTSKVAWYDGGREKAYLPDVKKVMAQFNFFSEDDEKINNRGLYAYLFKNCDAESRKYLIPIPQWDSKKRSCVTLDMWNVIDESVSNKTSKKKISLRKRNKTN